MSIITAKGSQARENAQSQSVDLSSIYLRLKEGESHKVRLLGVEDYVEYTASGDFNLGIFNQAVGPDSPLVIAHKQGGETFKGLYTKPRYVFVFASLETGELVAWDASKSQAKSLISTIEEYAEDIADVAFNFKRTGNKTETVYSLNPILRLKGEDKEAFDKFNNEEVTMEFFESIIKPKDRNFLVKLLVEVDPEIAKLFPDVELGEEVRATETSSLTITDDDLPF